MGPVRRARRFEVGGEEFLLDRRPFQVVSGAMHYWRVVPGQWRDRIAWARHLGLNTLETYVPWNLHEPTPGAVRFADGLDLRRYLELIAEAGLYAIVRPGPYICAELDFGGLPAWLLRPPAARIRSSDPAFTDRVAEWLATLLERLVDLQCTRGGPILAMQVENELGAYRSDREYLGWLVGRFRAGGVEVPLLSSDHGELTSAGTHPGLLATMNFGAEPDRAWRALAEAQPGGPRMCMEFWNGWFDHWGEPHHRRPADEVAATLDEMLADGASVNLYMFCGGTNFGFTNGANTADRSGAAYQPTITSYDYDAPLSEDGRPTAKFDRYRAVLAGHLGVSEAPRPPLPAPLADRTVALTRAIPLLDAVERLCVPVTGEAPASMEALEQNFGFVCYRFRAAGPGRRTLRVPGIRDRGQVLLDGVERGLLDRASGVTAVELELPPGETRVDVLVENQGRVNFGPGLCDAKGILGEITLGGVAVTALRMYPLPLDNLDELDWSRAALAEDTMAGPLLVAGAFEIDRPADTHLALPGWTKGVAWVNGFNLGRYWEIGPQRTLYLPGPLLRHGGNELRVLELHRLRAPEVRLVSRPDLGE
jgi:beta-galactosidase